MTAPEKPCDPRVHAERTRLKNKWPDAWRDGMRVGLGLPLTGARERGDYPKGFHGWALDQRNAWFAAFNIGFLQRRAAPMTPDDDQWKSYFDPADLAESDNQKRQKRARARTKRKDNGPRDIPPLENEPEAAPPDLGEVDAADALAAMPPPRGWLLGTVFCRTFLSSLIAEGGAGKTALRYAQLISLAIGRSLTGEHVFLRCRVLIISLEDDLDELKRRVFAVAIHHGVNPEELRGWLFFAAPGAAIGKIMTLDRGGRPTPGSLAAAIEAAVVRRNADIVALDPFIKAHAVPENDNAMIDQVAQILSDLASKHNIAVDIPHHVRKGPSDPGNADRGRGASAARDAARLVYSLSTMTSDEAETFDIPEEQRRFYIRMDKAKVNIAPPATKAQWFKLVSVALGNASDLYPSGDEVQTVEPWRPPQTWEGLDSGSLNRVLDVIEAGLENGERYTDENAARTRAAWRVVQHHAPDKSEAQCKEIIRQWIKNRVLACEQYHSASERKARTGLRVNNARRPGTTSDG